MAGAWGNQENYLNKKSQGSFALAFSALYLPRYFAVKSLCY
jgi:hypothetical protein